MITYTTPNQLIAAAQARGIFIGSRSLREDVAVELSRLLGEQVHCAFSVGGVGSAAFSETSAQTTARTGYDTSILQKSDGSGPNKTKPYDKR